MKTILRAVAAAVALAALSASAQQPAPEVTLTRLDCGSGNNDQRTFSDSFAYTNPQVPFTFSCYVIKHGDDYMVWDTGYLPGSVPSAPKVTLGQQLTQMNVRPEQVKFVGISHFHPDHTGQLDTVPNATLLIGERDWAALKTTPPMAGANVAGFTHWLTGGGKVEPQAADKDVFGDGTVRLKQKGPVVLMGDAAHFHENYQSEGVPVLNYDRAQTIASMQRIKQIEKNLKATVIIQHDPRDIAKLPTFPAAAK
jgi:N-acyl homoserine lactone hydrolase